MSEQTYVKAEKAAYVLAKTLKEMASICVHVDLTTPEYYIREAEKMLGIKQPIDLEVYSKLARAKQKRGKR